MTKKKKKKKFILCTFERKITLAYKSVRDARMTLKLESQSRSSCWRRISDMYGPSRLGLTVDFTVAFDTWYAADKGADTVSKAAV